MDSINYRTCAACKHMRRSCRPDCILRPYFPADQSTNLNIVRRLYTISKLKKLLQLTRGKDPRIPQEMMKSIKFEAAIRARYPVHGTLKYGMTLLYKIKVLEDELFCVKNKLVSAKNAAAFSFDDSQMRPLERTLPVSNDNVNTIDLFADSGLFSQDIFQSILDLEDDEDSLL